MHLCNQRPEGTQKIVQPNFDLIKMCQRCVQHPKTMYIAATSPTVAKCFLSAAFLSFLASVVLSSVFLSFSASAVLHSFSNAVCSALHFVSSFTIGLHSSGICSTILLLAASSFALQMPFSLALPCKLCNLLF